MKISRLFLKVFCTKNPGSISEVTSKRFPGWMCGRIPEKNPSDNLEKNQEKLLKELWKQFRGKNAWDVFGEILGERNPSMNFWGMDGGCSEWIPRIPLHFFILKLIFQILSRNQRNASQVWIKLQVYFAFVFTFCHFFPEFSVQFSYFFQANLNGKLSTNILKPFRNRAFQAFLAIFSRNLSGLLVWIP